MTYEPNLVIDITTGQVMRVPLTPAEVVERDDLAAEVAAEPIPIDPVADVIAQVVNAPDFDTAKKNLAAYVANRQGK